MRVGCVWVVVRLCAAVEALRASNRLLEHRLASWRSLLEAQPPQFLVQPRPTNYGTAAPSSAAWFVRDPWRGHGGGAPAHVPHGGGSWSLPTPPSAAAPSVPAPAAPAPAVPAVVEPAPAVPAPAVPAVVEPAPAVPAVVEPAPAVPAVVVPAVVEPAPAVPAVVMPAVVEPAPAVTAPAVPAPAVPAVVEPAPPVPAVVVPAVVEPAPAVVVPAVVVPAPAVPAPAVPAPAVSGPAIPTAAVANAVAVGPGEGSLLEVSPRPAGDAPPQAAASLPTRALPVSVTQACSDRDGQTSAEDADTDADADMEGGPNRVAAAAVGLASPFSRGHCARTTLPGTLGVRLLVLSRVRRKAIRHGDFPGPPVAASAADPCLPAGPVPDHKVTRDWMVNPVHAAHLPLAPAGMADVEARIGSSIAAVGSGFARHHNDMFEPAQARLAGDSSFGSADVPSFPGEYGVGCTRVGALNGSDTDWDQSLSAAGQSGKQSTVGNAPGADGRCALCLCP
jgi:hypothetical protein